MSDVIDNDILQFVETNNNDDSANMVAHEAPFTHSDKLAQSSDESEIEYSDDESVYGWSTDDDDEGYETSSSSDTIDANCYTNNTAK